MESSGRLADGVMSVAVELQIGVMVLINLSEWESDILTPTGLVF